MKDTSVAPSLHAAREALIREQIADGLEKKLDRRPSRGELVDHNILKNTGVSPNLQAATSQLEKEQLADSLEKKISQRPGQQDLVEKNIIPKEQH